MATIKKKAITTSDGKTHVVKQGSKADTTLSSQAGSSSTSNKSTISTAEAGIKSRGQSRDALGVDAYGTSTAADAPKYIPPPTINSGVIAPTGQINLPKIPGVSGTGTAAMTTVGALGAAAAGNPDNAGNAADDAFATYLKSIQKPPSTEKLYKQTQNEVGLQEKQQIAANFTNQLNAITAKANADKLSLTGSGRGIPEAIIGGQQARIDRDAAIQSLPIAAQLAAAQGDVALAQSHLDTLFKIRAEDAIKQADYKNKVADAVYGYASDKQKALLDAKKTADERAFTLTRDTINYAQQLAAKAIENGQPSLAGRIMALDHSSPTYAQDVANLSSGIYVTSKSTGGGTESERLNNAVATINAKIVPDATTPSGLTILNPAGDYINPAAWKDLITHAPEIGVSRSAFISNWGNRLYIDPKTSKPATSYGLTPAELKDLGY